MLIETYIPKDREAWLELRRKDVTASDIGALFDLHPYKTKLAVYYDKLGQSDLEDKDNVAMRRGRLMENTVAAAFQEDHPKWRVEKASEYIRASEHRIGCTPDFLIEDENGRKGVLQTKTVAPGAFDKWWGADPPMWVILQNATEMMLTQRSWGVIAALIVDGWRFELREYHIEQRHGPTEEKIKAAVHEFWRAFGDGIPPEVDYARDAATIALMSPNEKPGKEIDLRGDNHIGELLSERDSISRIVKAASERKSEIDAEIRHKLGDAERALVDGWSISLKTREGYTAQVKPSRVLRINKRREENDGD